jgi:hypothetical protein
MFGKRRSEPAPEVGAYVVPNCYLLLCASPVLSAKPQMNETVGTDTGTQVQT